MHAFAVAFLLMAGTIPDAMDRLENSFARLKEAQTGTDAAQVQALAGNVWTASREILAEPQPEDVESKGEHGRSGLRRATDMSTCTLNTRFPSQA